MDAAEAEAEAATPASPSVPEARSGLETPVPDEGMSHMECIGAINKALKHPTVRFLREHMEKAGCPVWPRLFQAITCKEGGIAGGYTSTKGITVCCNHMVFQDEVNQVIIHELIHAYDDCRVKNIDWRNCPDFVCSEIRANHLSGDCHYKRELLRGFMKIRGHEQECVRRRSLQSIQNHPACVGEAGRKALESVWDVCYNDTYPFEKAP